MPFELTWMWVWVVLSAALIVGEIFTAGFFLLPFGIGAAAAAFTAYLGGPLVAQWVAFIGVSVATLVPLQRFADRVTQGPDLPVAGDRMLGKVGVVLETVKPHGITGRVRVGSEEWRAEADGEIEIGEGTAIEVLGVDGTHLIVKRREAATTGGSEGGAQ